MDSYTLTYQERATYKRYAGLALPRHTSYPAAPAWQSSYGADEFHDLDGSAANLRPLSIYVHIPFCQQLCYYCACTKEIVPLAKRRQADPGESWLDGLQWEADAIASIVGQSPVHQVHLGGGSPTFLTAAQLERLWRIFTHSLTVVPTGDIAVEIDPHYQP